MSRPEFNPFPYSSAKLAGLHGVFWLNSWEFYAISLHYPLVVKPDFKDDEPEGYWCACTSAEDRWHVSLMLSGIRTAITVRDRRLDRQEC